MSRIRQLVKRGIETATAWDIERIGGRSFALIDSKRADDGWFSRRRQLRSILEHLRIDLVLDVGANVGQFGRDLREIYAGELHSFEPVAATHEQLAAAAAGDPRWTVHRFALGSANTTLNIRVTGSTTFSSMLPASEFATRRFGDGATMAREEPVAVRRLDDVLEELVPNAVTRRIFLKMDTQGFDLEVFRGIVTNRRCVLALQSEVSLIPVYDGMPHWTESLRVYEEAGFFVAAMMPVATDGLRVVEYDCLLVRADG